MDRLTERSTKILAGLILAAATIWGQSYTISARPGAINYVEGTAFLNGESLSDKSLKGTFLSANDSFLTENGKAEVLLTPGVFLRVGENTEIRMISPSLTETKVEILNGEIMIEASGLVKDNHLQILDHGASITITQNGLYKFTADNPPTAAVLAGKAEVSYSDRQVGLKKGRETILASNLPVQRFDTKQENDLYAWSNVRSEYEAAASYRVSRAASINGFGGAGGLYNAYGNGSGPGWFWDSGFNSYAWLPYNGVFYSPFGYGFYSPAVVGYAPVVTTNVYRGGRPWRHPNGVPTTPVTSPATGFSAAVPVSVKNPPAIGNVGASPFAYHQARIEAARAFAAANPGASFNAGSVPPSGGWRGSAAANSAATAGNPHSNSAYSHANGAGSHINGGGFNGGGSHMGGGGGNFGGAGSHMSGGGGGHASAGGGHSSK